MPGVGKTTLAATASVVDGMAPVAFVNAESGMEALTEDIFAEDGTRIVDRSALQVTDFEDFKNLKQLHQYFAFSKHRFKTLVVDTLDEILERAVAKWDQYYIPINSQGLPNDRNEDNKMGLKVYNRATKEMTEVIRNLRDLPMHVLFLAHETDRPLEQGGSLRTRMELTPALYGFVEGALSIIGRLRYQDIRVEGKEEAETHRVLYFRSTNEALRVKDRTPGQCMGKLMVDPTMQKIWDRRIAKTSA